MDEQTASVPEQVTTTPNPVVLDTPTLEPSQAEVAEAPTEPVSTLPATPQTESVYEPIETVPEAPTAQMGRNEPLPDTPPQTQQGTAQPESLPQPTPMPAQAQILAPQNIVRLILTKARAVIQLRKQKKLIKIMSMFLKQTSISNDEVEKLLHVSDATATRYLSELEKQGKITQSGKTGHAVTYTKR